jgi:hypothetical protein
MFAVGAKSVVVLPHTLSFTNVIPTYLQKQKPMVIQNKKTIEH